MAMVLSSEGYGLGKRTVSACQGKDMVKSRFYIKPFYGKKFVDL
jgi:hypothetical protein